MIARLDYYEKSSRVAVPMRGKEKLMRIFQMLMKLMFGLGFFGLVTLDPDVPGEELTNQEMLVAYGVLLLMMFIPSVVQHALGWGWFSDLPPKKRWTTISTGQTHVGWLRWLSKH